MDEKKKNISISFLGNPEHDSRVSNLKHSLTGEGYSVSIIAFDWRTINSSIIASQYQIHKLNKSNPLEFYFKFFFLLLKELLKTNSSIYFAEDVYTLPIVYFMARIRKAKVIYDSREIYANLAGLRNKKVVQQIIEFLEKIFIKKVDLVLTTGEMDTELLKEKFDLKNIMTLRNLPLLNNQLEKINLRKKLNIQDGKLILLYQGVLLEGRGIELILETVSMDDDLVFVILGDGDFKYKFERISQELKIEDRVFFLGSISQSELINYTSAADIGLALIENISLSYYYALPNKLFEYVMAGVPVLCSDLPQMKKIIDNYEVGEAIDITEKDKLSSSLKKLKKDPKLLENYSRNCQKAADELNWENEFNKIKSVLLR